jgi:hypothetical protein
MKGIFAPLSLAVTFCGFLAGSVMADQPAATPATPAAPLPDASLTPAPLGPRVKFQDEKPEGVLFDAGKVTVSQPLKHTFYFTNVGDQTLEMPKVTGTCGCTTAGEWSKKVEPGDWGQIPIQVTLSPGWNGTMTKPATIDCNDKTKQPLSVNLRFTIWKPVDVSQQFVTLNIQPDAETFPSTSVRVDNNTEEPVQVYAPESTSKNFAVEIKTNDAGKHYELVIKAVPPFTPGNPASGQIVAKTSSTNMPEVRLTAMAMVPQAVIVFPPTVALEPAPLAAKSEKTITITYNGAKALALTEPSFNAKGVEVLVSEVRPGKEFRATLSFPQGFEAQGRPLAFTAKSSNPSMPVITVPVTQAATPVQPVAKPTSAVLQPVPPVTAARPAGVTPVPPAAAGR